MIFSRSTLSTVTAVAAILSSTTTAFAPSNLPFHHAVSSSALSMSAALIVQNKGGGHGELGFQLAKKLEGNSKITSITILQDDACNDEKEPFKSYPTDIPNVKVIKANLADDDSMTTDKIQSLLEGASFDYVWDNSSKKPVGAGKSLCDLAKSWNSKLYTYVSSAGMYQPSETTTFPMPETTPVKESAGQNLFDTYAIELGLPLVSIRPQYIYGPQSNKNDYIDWYFDRLVRNLPLPVPNAGDQKVSLTDSRDVASLLSAVLDDEEAAVSQRFFNCGTDELLSYDEVAYLCADAAGIERGDVKIEHYDAERFGKATFPFRMTDFYVAPDTAKAKLGWKGEYYYEGYVARGGPTKDISLVKDWEIVSGSESYGGADGGKIYNKWDPELKTDE